MSPLEYYEGVGAHDNEHPWAWKSCEQVLDEEVSDPTAKRFFKVMARSDLATARTLLAGVEPTDPEGDPELVSIQARMTAIEARLGDPNG